jgi:hypothetical protein
MSTRSHRRLDGASTHHQAGGTSVSIGRSVLFGVLNRGCSKSTGIRYGLRGSNRASEA